MTMLSLAGHYSFQNGYTDTSKITEIWDAKLDRVFCVMSTVHVDIIV